MSINKCVRSRNAIIRLLMNKYTISTLTCPRLTLLGEATPCQGRSNQTFRQHGSTSKQEAEILTVIQNGRNGVLERYEQFK